MSEEKLSMFSGEEKFVNTTSLKFPRNYLSISQINSYVICPMAYYWNYIEGKKEKRSSSMVVGSTGHRMFQLLADMKNMDFDVKDLQHRFNVLFDNTLADAGVEEKTAERILELSEERDKLTPSIIMYCQKALPKLNYLGQELQIQCDIPISKVNYTRTGKCGMDTLGKVTVAGFIDFIASKDKVEVSPFENDVFAPIKDKNLIPNLEVGDYKIGSPKDYTYFRDDLQMIYYSMATEIPTIRIDNIVAARLKYNKDGGPRKDNIPPSFNILKYKVTTEDQERVKAQISNAAIGIGSGAFPQCHSAHWKCSERMCGHWNYCRGKDAGKYLEKVAVEKWQDTLK